MDVFDLVAKLSLDKSDYDSGLGEAQEKGSKWGSALSTAGKTAVAGVTAVTTAIAGMTTATVKGVADVASYGDEIDKNSQKLGVSAQFYQEWDAVLQHSGTSMDAMGATFKKLATSSQSATDKQVEAFKQLGLSMDEVSSMSADELFANVVSGLQGMEEGTERTAIATTLLGKGAQEMGALLNTSAEDTQKMIQTVNDLGGVMSDDAVKASAGFQDSLQDLQTSLTGLKNGAMAEFLPACTDVMDGLTKIFSGDSEGGIAQLNEGISSFVDGLAEALPQILDFGAEIVTQLAESIIENLPTLVDTATEIITELVTKLIEMLPELAKAGLEILVSLAESIGDSIPTLIPTIVDVVLTIVDTLVENVDMLIDGAIALILGLAEGLIEALPQLIERVPEIIEKIVDALVRNAPKLIEGAIKLVVIIVKNLPKIIMGLIKAIPSVISSIMTAFGSIGKLLIELFKSAWDGVKKVFSGSDNWFKSTFEKAINAVKKVWNGIKEYFSGIWDDITGVFSGAWDTFKDIGGNLIQGIKDGILGAWDGFKSWVTDKFAGVIDDVKDVFGIASPSKVFKQIGEFCIEGLQDGSEELFSDEGLTAKISADVASGGGGVAGQVLELLEEYMPYLATAESMQNMKLSVNEREFGRLVAGVI